MAARAGRGRAVHVDPIKPTLKAPGSERLKLRHDKLPSNLAFNFNLRRYTVGAAPELDAIESDRPAHVCVLYRALAHAQVKRTAQLASTASFKAGGGEEVETSASKGWFGGWFGKAKTKPADESASDLASESDAESDVEMSEDDWDNLQKVFDVEGHVAAAAELAAEVEVAAPDILHMEVSVRVGSMSVQLVDDEEEQSATRADPFVPVVVMHAEVAGRASDCPRLTFKLSLPDTLD